MGAIKVKFDYSGNRVVTSSIDNCIRVFDKQGDEFTLTKTIPLDVNDKIWNIDIKADGSEVLGGAVSLLTVDLESGSVSRKFSENSKFIYSLAYVPLNRVI